MTYCYHCMTQLEDKKLNTCPNCGKSLTQEPLQPRYLKPGTVLKERFLVGYPLGSGGFGNTYIGWDQTLLRKVAIKEFYPEQYSGRTTNGVSVSVANKELEPRFHYGLRQFLEEARSVAALQDVKGVVKISKFFQENGTGYIIMEYLEGMDIKTILKKSGNKKDYEWSRRVILTVLHTLREIHKRGVIHRDISPDNIFVTNEGVIKLIDFGAAKHASATESMSADIILKPGYAPLEQYSREAKQGSYTDLYAVAALFYRMIVGQKPIPASERIEDDPLIPPSEMGIEIPEQAEMGMMVCLNVKPEYRLQSAEEFMEALDGKDFVPVYEPEWILPADYGKKSMKSKVAAMPKRIKILMCVLAICVAGGAIVGGRALTDTKEQQDVSGTQKSMPDFNGKDLNEVKKNLEDQGINKINVIYKISDKDENTIIDQSPKAGSESKKNSEVTLTVSGGKKRYTMPDFTGWDKESIIYYFTDQGIQVTKSDNPYDKKGKVKNKDSVSTKDTPKVKICSAFADRKQYKKDMFIGFEDQSTKPGEAITTDQTINVSVGGEESDYIIKIPKLVKNGKNEDEIDKLRKRIRKKLKKVGLSGKVKVDVQHKDNGKKKGKVYDQSKEGEIYVLKLKKPYTVTFWVSNGLKKKVPPTGTSQAQSTTRYKGRFSTTTSTSKKSTSSKKSTTSKKSTSSKKSTTSKKSTSSQNGKETGKGKTAELN